jgi:hypothetical protein
MRPNPEFVSLGGEFWANVRLISQHVGYTERVKRERRPKGQKPKKISGPIKVPTFAEITAALEDVDLSSAHLMNAPTAQPTDLGRRLVAYFSYRADMLNDFVERRLMDRQNAQTLFERLRSKLCPKCPLPMNKQKGKKKGPAFFTGIINMLIESNSQGFPCDYDPRELISVTRNNQPFRTLARRIDGAFPSPVNPIAVWEIKEYYNTTTFGSRVADGVYESLLDGMELQELRDQGTDVKHYLMIDDHFTWWDCGRSYLCRIIDMLHMGYVDEVLFGTEVTERLPAIVKDWVKIANEQRSKTPAVREG